MLEYFPKSNQIHKTLIIYLQEKRKVALFVKAYIVACGKPGIRKMQMGNMQASLRNS